MKLVVFSDLDGTLLDPVTYSWQPATEALAALRAREAAIIFVTSKTLAEVAPLYHELELKDPFIFENGGGIATRMGDDLTEYLKSHHDTAAASPDGEFVVIPLGEEYPDLVLALAEISDDLDMRLIGFSSMSNNTVKELTGLRLQDAVKARNRLFDEPFVVPEESLHRRDEILEAANRRGLRIVNGGRFLHLMGHPGKGEAVSILVEAFRQRWGELLTIGLGDSPNDFPFLQLVQVPILLGASERHHKFPDTLKNLRRIESPGPAAWNRAILEVLSGL